MVMISPAVDDADPPPPYYDAGSDAYASSSFPPPPLQSHGHDLACYAVSIMDTSSFPQLPPPPVYMPPELSYLYYPQPQFGPVLEPAGIPIRPEQLLQMPTTQPASMPQPSYYPQTQAATAGSASVEEASPALADTQQAQEDDTRSTPRRRGRPSKRALAVSEPPLASKPTKRVAVGSNRAVSSSSQKTTMSSAAPDQAGGSSSSTGSTSDQQMLLCDERCQLLQRPGPYLSNGAAAGVVVDGEYDQQAAIASPELVATGPQYADTSAVGVRFQPKDEQLIEYLRMKYAGQQMPVKFIKDFDVYQAHPMAIKGACGESQNGCWYAFSRRDRRYKNGKRPARSVRVLVEGGRKHQQVGFWKSNNRLSDVRAGGKKDGAVIGRMTSLTFQLGQQPRGKQTGWKMREYTIPENQHQPDGSDLLLNDWVICQLFYKERPGCTNAESNTDENATSVGVGQEQERPFDMHVKIEKGKNDTSVGQKRPRRSRKSKNDIPVAVGKEEDGPGEAAGESVQGEEDLQPQMVPAVHQPDYYEQDLCVEDYLVCDDVAFAQQNDAASTI